MENGTIEFFELMQYSTATISGGYIDQFHIGYVDEYLDPEKHDREKVE